LIHTHVITGFLGTGKTTTLQYLLKQKPAHEKWVVLLNEFGKTGLDSDLLNNDEVVVSQVAGGCLCCATPLLFQTALNKIIRFEKPQRILIEPSGLGHPDKIVELLKQDQYQKILKIEAVLTLIDARNLNDKRYREHDIYQRQLAVADIFIANKKELATDQQLAGFEKLLEKYQRPGIQVSQGQVNLDTIQKTVHNKPRLVINKVSQEGNPFFTYTIALDANKIFSLTALLAYLVSLDLARVKAVVPTKDGAVLVNGVKQEITTQPTDLIADNFRLEIISAEELDIASVTDTIHSFTEKVTE